MKDFNEMLATVRGPIPDILDAPWAILKAKLEEIHDVYQAHLDGRPLDLSQYPRPAGTRQADTGDQAYQVVDGVAVIPVQGTIARRMNLFMQFSGGTSTELLQRDFLAAMDDPAVQAILLAVDSPGGLVGGTTTLAESIYAARGMKPIVAHAADMMASAAYWIASAADYIIAEDASVVGSIGVISMHTDRSAADAKAGIKRTFITAGKYKALGNDAEPLSMEAMQEISARLDYIYTLFVDTVARNRGTDQNTVLKKMADGKTFIGKQARDAGLVDSIGTIEDALVQALSMIRTDQPSYLIRRR